MNFSDPYGTLKHLIKLDPALVYRTAENRLVEHNDNPIFAYIRKFLRNSTIIVPCESVFHFPPRALGATEDFR